MSRVEKAVSSFRGDFNCAQSILSTYGIQYGLNRDTALKLATGFGGGMARFGRTCGAISAAFMVIGLKYGMGINGKIKLKEKTYQLIREFSSQFQGIHGSLICRELLECDINTPEGKNYYSQNELFEKKCLQYVKNSAEILEKILE
ncbi:MAG: C-GCAxxG-C-C family protein [Candidatus Hodarchaeota archaeon]